MPKLEKNRLQIPKEILNCTTLNLQKPVFLYKQCGDDPYLSNSKKINNCYGRIYIDENNGFEMPKNLLRALRENEDSAFKFYVSQSTVFFRASSLLEDSKPLKKLHVPQEIRDICKVNFDKKVYLCVGSHKTYLSNACKMFDWCYGTIDLDNEGSFEVTKNMTHVLGNNLQEISFSTFGNRILIDIC